MIETIPKDDIPYDEEAPRKIKKDLFVSYAWYVIKNNPVTLIGAFILSFFVFMALAAPIITPFGPVEINVKNRLQPPSLTHIFGTDKLGMDIYSRVVYATRIDLLIAFGGVSLAMLIGVPLGAIIGYSPSKFDEVAMRIVDGINAFPMFILALAIASAIGPGIGNVIIVVAFVNFPSYLRLVRGQVLSLKQRQFIEAARSVGNSPMKIIFRHLLPNTLGPVLVLACLNTAWAILTAAALSFVGVGVTLPNPEWGLMVNQGIRYVTSGEWWISFFPGMAISLIVLGLNLVGDSLNDIVDPRRRFR